MKQTFTNNIIIPEGGPPSEIQVLKYGQTDTTEGPYFLDDKGADSVLRIFYKRNIDLYFDYDHKSLDPQTPEQGKAAGWFELEKREDGVWAKNIRWTEQAAEYLRNREYRYFSPVLKTDENGNVYRLVNIALTNLPATDDLEPLIELKDSLEELQSDVAQIVDEITDAIIENITDTKVDGETMKEHLDRIDSVLDHAMGLGHSLNKHMMETEGEMRACFDKAHGTVMKMIDVLKEKRKEMDPEGMYMERKPYSEDIKLSEKVKELTGTEDFDKQVGALMAYKESKESIKALNEQISLKDQEIKKLKDEVARREKEDIVTKAIEGPTKKLLLKQKDWALSLKKEQLEAYLESAPVLSLSEKIIEKVVEEKQATLSESELKFISMLNRDGIKISAEDLLKSKKEKGLI